MPTPNQSKVKIAYFHLAFLYSGGGEKLALKEIQLLRKKGYRVDAYSPLIDESVCFPDIIKQYNIKEIIPGITRLFHAKPELGVMLVCLLFPFIAHKYRKYDVVIGANQPGPIFGYILKRFFNIPYLIYIAQPTRILYKRPIDQEVGLQIKKTMKVLPHIVNICRPFFYWIDLKSILCANVFLTNGTYMQNILSQIYGKVPKVCSPGAKIYDNIKGINNQQSIYNFRTTSIPKPYIFMSNRHFPHKKFEYALEALDLMEEKIPLVISGEKTEYTEELMKLVRYYKLEKFVYFLGYVTESELHGLYANCEMYLYTSPEEDFGMGIVEAMAHGKPVISWNNAGPSQTITHQQNGFLAELGNVTELTKYIKLCLNNKEYAKKIAKNSLKHAQNKYSWKKHGEIIEGYINQIISPSLTRSDTSAFVTNFTAYENFAE